MQKEFQNFHRHRLLRSIFFWKFSYKISFLSFRNDSKDRQALVCSNQKNESLECRVSLRLFWKATEETIVSVCLQLNKRYWHIYSQMTATHQYPAPAIATLQTP